MNKYFKMATMATTAAVMGMSTMSLAEGAPSSERFTVGISGESSIDNNGSSETRVYGDVAFKLTESVKASIKIDLKQAYDAALDDTDFDWDKYLEEAKFEIQLNAFGTPVLVVIGKQPIKLRANLSALDSESSLLGEHEQRGVVGLTVHVKPAYLDSASISVSETVADDLDIDTDTIRVTANAAKTMDMFVVSGSVSYELNDLTDDEYAATFGVVADLSTTFNVEGLRAAFQGSYDSDGENGFSIEIAKENQSGTTILAGYEQLGNQDRLMAGISYKLKGTGIKVVDGSTIQAMAYVDANDRTNRGLDFRAIIPFTKIWGR